MGAAARIEAGMACSRPAAPAMVSRRDSAQAARPSRRFIAARSSAAPPVKPFQAITRATAPTATTGQPVTTRVAASGDGRDGAARGQRLEQPETPGAGVG